MDYVSLPWEGRHRRNNVMEINTDSVLDILIFSMEYVSESVPQVIKYRI